MNPIANISIAIPHNDNAFLYILTEILPRVLSKIYAMKVLTNIIEIKNDKISDYSSNHELLRFEV